MAKNIVICSDGTGNTAIKGRGTNVFKLYEAVDLHQPPPAQQVAIYDDGVGTQKWKPLKLLSGAFGWGLSRNVKKLYANLSRVYESKDQIFLFGFSRGAFTVRTLADFICSRGLLDPEKCDDDADFLKQVNRAYSNYRNKYWSFFGRLFALIKWAFGLSKLKEEAFQEVAHIRFIGVWDTVDAVGLPSDAATAILNKFYKFKFNNSTLNGKVKKACHALAIDDERGTFSPVMWDEQGNKGDRIEQVWFSGVHSNVGGGYPKQGMSLVSLDWMMARAEAAELKFLDHDQKLYKNHRNFNDKLYDSRSGFAVYYRYQPRNIRKISEKNNITSKHNTTPKIHISTVARIAQGTEGYSPGNLPSALKIVSTDPLPASYKKIEEEIFNAHNGSESLLKKYGLLVWLRILAYFGFVACTLWILVGYFITELRGSNPASFLEILKGIWDALTSLFLWDGLKKILVSLWNQPLVLKGLILSVAIGLGTRWRMHKVFSEFWYPLQSKLRDLLKILGNPR